MDINNVPELSFDLSDDYIAQRAQRAIELLDKVNVKDKLILASVGNGQGKEYPVIVNCNKGLCTCPDFRVRGLEEAKPCKHILAVKLVTATMYVQSAAPAKVQEKK